MIDTRTGAINALQSLAERLELPLELIIQLRDDYITSLNPRGSVKFNPQTFVAYTVEHLQPSWDCERKSRFTKELLRVYLRKQNFEAVAHGDVAPVLSDIAKCMVVGTFSEGVHIWQLYKLYCTRLLRFFTNAEHRKIFADKRTDSVINALPQYSIITDDNVLVIALLWAAQQRRQGIYPIWVNRENEESPPGLQDVPQIPSYEYLPDAIHQIQTASSK